MSLSEFRTDNLDLSAAIWTATDVRPTVNPGRKLVEFIHPNDETVIQTVISYSSGSLEQNIKKFAGNRGLLYRIVNEVRRSGRAL